MLAPDSQGLAFGSLGVVELAQTPLRVADVCQGESDLETVFTKGGPRGFQACLKCIDRLPVETEIKVDSGENISQFHLHLRLVGQLDADALFGLIQNSPEQRGVLSQRNGRADAVEHVLQELSDLLALGGFCLGNGLLGLRLSTQARLFTASSPFAEEQPGG